MCSLAWVRPRSRSDLLDQSTVTQCEVQVGHRYTVHVCACITAPLLAALPRALNFWILAPLHSVRCRLVIVAQFMCALALVRPRSLISPGLCIL